MSGILPPGLSSYSPNSRPVGLSADSLLSSMRSLDLSLRQDIPGIRSFHAEAAPQSEVSAASVPAMLLPDRQEIPGIGLSADLGLLASMRDLESSLFRPVLNTSIPDIRTPHAEPAQHTVVDAASSARSGEPDAVVFSEEPDLLLTADLGSTLQGIPGIRSFHADSLLTSEPGSTRRQIPGIRSFHDDDIRNVMNSDEPPPDSAPLDDFWGQFDVAPAFDRVIMALPTHTVCAEDVSTDASEERSCSICISEFSEGDTRRTLQCFHSFHTECIDPWLHRCGCCPICRHRVG